MWGAGGMLVRTGQAPWQQPQSSGYLNEAELQTMLAEQPSLIPGVGPGAVAVRELQSGVGPTDVCVVDGDGSVTVVECKLTTNQEARRKIIGQVLDYASRLWRMDVEDFDARWRARSGGASVLEVLADSEEAPAALADNLRAGRFTLVLAVDSINDDLRRIVEYLNLHTTEGIHVFALELRRAHHGDVDILLPQVYGRELAASKAAVSGSSAGWQATWVPGDVTEFLTEHRPELVDPLTGLIAALAEMGFEAHGTGARDPSLIMVKSLPGGNVWPYAVYTGDSPRLQVNFRWTTSASMDSRLRFVTALAEIHVISDPTTVTEGGLTARPSIPLQKLAEPGQIDGLAAAAGLLE